MGTVTIQEHTTLHPIAMIGEEAGICWGADTTSIHKNIKRGKSCLKSGHLRTAEYPVVYMVLDGYSARVMREFYTHIAGAPTRLQASTRYIDYEHGFDYIIPHTIENNPKARDIYVQNMIITADNLRRLDECGIPREDSANLLPLGMTSKMVVKMNFRTLMTMSNQRMCSRAYWEFRELFRDIAKALSEYSVEWEELVNEYFMPKCELYGYCLEEHGCGMYPKKGE